jgi:hypothetical protein
MNINLSVLSTNIMDDLLIEQIINYYHTKYKKYCMTFAQTNKRLYKIYKNFLSNTKLLLIDNKDTLKKINLPNIEKLYIENIDIDNDSITKSKFCNMKSLILSSVKIKEKIEMTCLINKLVIENCNFDLADIDNLWSLEKLTIKNTQLHCKKNWHEYDAFDLILSYNLKKLIFDVKKIKWIEAISCLQNLEELTIILNDYGQQSIQPSLYNISLLRKLGKIKKICINANFFSAKYFILYSLLNETLEHLIVKNVYLTHGILKIFDSRKSVKITMINCKSNKKIRKTDHKKYIF